MNNQHILAIAQAQGTSEEINRVKSELFESLEYIRIAAPILGDELRDQVDAAIAKATGGES